MDYECAAGGESGLSAAEIRELGLAFPDAHRQKDAMKTLSLALKEKEASRFCELPFCHTLEAESMGGKINFGDETNGPRAAEYIASKIEDILALPDIDYTKGRMREALSAALELSQAGETVLLSVSGPLTILNALIDSKYVFRAMRKEPDLTRRVFRKIERELIRYLAEAEKRGVRIVSYADPTAGVRILGPKLTEWYVDEFAYPFLKNVSSKFGRNLLIALCPKVTFALIGVDKAEFAEVYPVGAVPYGDALACLIGKETFVGHICVKNKRQILTDGTIKTIRLNA
jgi:uroporphyrinogen-III decarboxylase